MKKVIIGCAILAAILFGTWYYASPAYALEELRDAAMSGDAAELDKRVDFVRLRTSMKTQMREKIEPQLAVEDDPVRKMGMELGFKTIDGIVETYFTPEAAAAAFKESAQQGQGPLYESLDPDAFIINREGLNQFRLIPAKNGEADEELATMIFERDGFEWRLVEFDMSHLSLVPDN